MNETKLNIAVVGAGVAGITAAQMLHEKHNVTLFERNDYLGGHTNTIILDDGPDEGTPIDTGFIVFNDRTYPTFQKLLNRLDVDYRKSEMSWSYYDEASDFYYSGSNINGLFARRSNLLNATFLSMVYDIVRFNRQARRDLFNGQLGQDTLENYLIRRRFSRAFVSHYLMPMGAAIWSSAPSDIAGFPAEMYIRFFENHGLLHLTNRPQWYTVEGGSHSYVNKFVEGFNGEIQLCARIESIHRSDSGVVILFDDKSSRRFDKVVLATHADQALHLLAQPTDNEKRLLRTWKYSRNRCTLHTDNSLMPPSRRAWSSWNYVREGSNGSNESAGR